MRLTASHMEISNITEYESVAKEKLPKMIYDYYASGVEDQWTLKENRNAFSRILHCLHWLHLALKKLPLPDLGLDFSSFIMDDEEKVISLNLEVLSYTTKTPRGGPLVYDKLSSYYGVNALMDR